MAYMHIALHVVMLKNLQKISWPCIPYIPEFWPALRWVKKCSLMPRTNYTLMRVHMSAKLYFCKFTS